MARVADFWDPVKDDDNVKDDDSDSNDVDSDLDDSPTGLREVIENRYHIPMVGKCQGAGGPGSARFVCRISFVRDFLCFIGK